MLIFFQQVGLENPVEDYLNDIFRWSKLEIKHYFLLKKNSSLVDVVQIVSKYLINFLSSWLFVKMYVLSNDLQ